MSQAKNVIVHPPRLAVPKRTIYIAIFVPVFLLLTLTAALLSYEWTAYGYLLSEGKKSILLIGGATSERNCHRKARRKLAEGVWVRRYDQANTYFCGKYCLELPGGSVHCMLTREPSELSERP